MKEGNTPPTHRAVHARRRGWLIGLVIVCPALLLVAAACGGGSNGSDNAGTDPSASPAQGSPGVSQLSDEVSQKLKDLSKQWAKTNAKVTYSITGKTNGQASNGSLILYWAPPRVRVDISTDTDGTSNQTITISTPDNTLDCSPDGGGQCLAYPAVTNAVDALPFLSDFDPAAIETAIRGFGNDIKVESSDEKVAGSDASCVSATGNLGGQDGSVKSCFGGNGLLLFESSADAAGVSAFTLQATDIGETSDSDFQPPYPVTEAPTESPAPTTTPETPATTPGG